MVDLASRDRFEARDKSLFIAFDHSVTQTNGATSVRGNVALVRDQNDGMAAVIKVFEQRHDFLPGL